MLVSKVLYENCAILIEAFHRSLHLSNSSHLIAPDRLLFWAQAGARAGGEAHTWGH